VLLLLDQLNVRVQIVLTIDPLTDWRPRSWDVSPAEHSACAARTTCASAASIHLARSAWRPIRARYSRLTTAD